MHRRRFFWFSLVVVLSITSLAQAADKAEFRAGAAASNITPPIGLPVIGGFSPAPSTDIHDDLHARCLVLDDGQRAAAVQGHALHAFEQLQAGRCAFSRNGP